MTGAGGVRLGAYLLAADPTWLRSSLARYYDDLDVLLVSASASNTGWKGTPVAADECVAAALSMDTRGIARVVREEWVDPRHPIRADTAQRQNAIDLLSDEVDWILQIDSDEVLPDAAALRAMIGLADRRGAEGVEWPMRVLYRRLRDGRFLQITTANSRPHYEYPGPIAVRAGAGLVEARRTGGPFLRPVVAGDTESLQVTRPPEDLEARFEGLDPSLAIIHNSWARSPEEVRRKVTSWGHNQGLRSTAYFWLTWSPAPLRWRRMRNFHPFAPSLWPRLAPPGDDVTRFLLSDDR